MLQLLGIYRMYNEGSTRENDMALSMIAVRIQVCRNLLIYQRALKHDTPSGGDSTFDVARWTSKGLHIDKAELIVLCDKQWP
jgi:hypothetical protein